MPQYDLLLWCDHISHSDNAISLTPIVFSNHLESKASQPTGRGETPSAEQNTLARAALAWQTPRRRTVQTVLMLCDAGQPEEHQGATERVQRARRFTGRQNNNAALPTSSKYPSRYPSLARPFQPSDANQETKQAVCALYVLSFHDSAGEEIGRGKTRASS